MAPGLKLARFRHSLSCGYEAFFHFQLTYFMMKVNYLLKNHFFVVADLFFDDILCRGKISPWVPNKHPVCFLIHLRTSKFTFDGLVILHINNGFYINFT